MMTAGGRSSGSLVRLVGGSIILAQCHRAPGTISGSSAEGCGMSANGSSGATTCRDGGRVFQLIVCYLIFSMGEYNCQVMYHMQEIVYFHYTLFLGSFANYCILNRVNWMYFSQKMTQHPTFA